MTALVYYINHGTMIDGVLAGTKSALLRALTLIEDLGPTFGIFINLSKCELFCRADTAMFPTTCTEHICLVRSVASAILSRIEPL